MTKRAILFTTTATIALAFENEPGWKMDGDKIAVNGDGNPIYIDSSGREVAIKHDTISTLNGEAKMQRERNDTLQRIVDKYKGPDGKPIDPDAAIKAIDTVKKIDGKQLIDAGKVDELREQMRGEFTTQLTEKDRALQEAQQKIDTMTIDGIFKGSDFIAERIAVPRDMVEASLRSHFKVKEGKIEAYDKDGNPLMSKKSPGDYADPNEAIELLIERHPQKDMILKAPDANGSGNQGGAGSRGKGNMMKRSEFDALDQAGRVDASAKAAKGELTITD